MVRINKQYDIKVHPDYALLKCSVIKVDNLYENGCYAEFLTITDNDTYLISCLIDDATVHVGELHYLRWVTDYILAVRKRNELNTSDAIEEFTEIVTKQK